MAVEYIKTKTILTRVKQDDRWFRYDYGMNLYRGCSHRCIYCDSRAALWHRDLTGLEGGCHCCFIMS